MFLKPLEEENYYVESWGNKALAECAEFRLDPGDGTRGSEIYFFAKDEELVAFLTGSSGQLYLYGAAGQVNVLQMRVKGSMTLEAASHEAQGIREHRRALITEKMGQLTDQYGRDRFKECIELIDTGQLFCFHPTEYAWSSYERG